MLVRYVIYLYCWHYNENEREWFVWLEVVPVLKYLDWMRTRIVKSLLWKWLRFYTSGFT